MTATAQEGGGSTLATPLDRDILVALRRVTVLLLVDRLGLRAPLRRGVEDGEGTAGRVLRAAEAAGLAVRGENGLVWTADHAGAAADDEAWDRALRIARHQVGYLRLATDEWAAAPPEQVDEDPAAYRDFLRGVDASHRRHAAWFASLPQLAGCVTLAELGGGLGTFTRAWAASAPERRAILADLPGVVALAADEGLPAAITLRALDLRTSWEPIDADVHLLANVLHLLDGWRDTITGVAAAMRRGTTLAVFEARRDSPSGAMFDLQVHLRSGLRGGLLGEDDLLRALETENLTVGDRLETADADDPFKRTYTLTLARRT